MIQAKAPGKLFIAGEYAVVNHGFPSILVAVNRFITVSIEECREEGSIISRQYAHLPLKWKRVGNQFIIEKRDNPFHYILEAISICEEYALALGRSLKIYNLRVDSELDSQEGAKYGLGSSAAVTVATVRALFRLYEIEEDDLTIYKLACLAHMKLGSNGSFGDLAASSVTGWIAYQCFDRVAVLAKRNVLSLPDLLAEEWPSLLIRRLEPLTDYKLLIAWTQSPASTPSLVDRISQTVDPLFYERFLQESRQLVTTMIKAFDENDGKQAAAMLKSNRSLLKALNPSIETPDLTRLIDIASPYGAAKTSGAGGGDCGIVLVDEKTDIEPLIKAWHEADIICLNLTVYDKGVTAGRKDNE